MGKFSAKSEQFKPAETFQFIINMFKPQSKLMNCKINFQSLKYLPDPDKRELLLNHESTESELPELMEGDNIRLKQLLINFTKNATKFTQNGVISIKAAYDAQDRLLKVQISDTGKGINPADKHKLFQAFGKLQQTEHLNREGVGMGLVICKKIVDNCGGTIDVYSEGENKGSTFTFSMAMALPSIENISRTG